MILYSIYPNILLRPQIKDNNPLAGHGVDWTSNLFDISNDMPASKNHLKFILTPRVRKHQAPLLRRIQPSADWHIVTYFDEADITVQIAKMR